MCVLNYARIKFDFMKCKKYSPIISNKYKLDFYGQSVTFDNSFSVSNDGEKKNKIK